MAKRIKNPITLEIVKQDDSVKCQFHYGVECDDGLALRRMFIYELPPEELPPPDERPVEGYITPAEQSHMEQDFNWALGKIKEHEEMV